MSLSTDPITLAAQGIWTVLESHEPLASLVRIQNRLKLDGTNLDPLGKTAISSSDLPEIRVVPQSWTPTDHNGQAATSSSRYLTITFGITICTDKLRTGDPTGVYPVMWETLVALWGAVNTVPGVPSVRYFWPSGGSIEFGVRGESEENPAAGVRGWACIAQVRATLVLNKQSLGITE